MSEPIRGRIDAFGLNKSSTRSTKPLSTSSTPEASDGNKEFPDMDHDAQSLMQPPASRWAMFLAFVCFAMASGFLLSSLSKARPASAVAAPTAALTGSAIT
jgi:hypothetical protein